MRSLSAADGAAFLALSFLGDSLGLAMGWLGDQSQIKIGFDAKDAKKKDKKVLEAERDEVAKRKGHVGQLRRRERRPVA